MVFSTDVSRSVLPVEILLVYMHEVVMTGVSLVISVDMDGVDEPLLVSIVAVVTSWMFVDASGASSAVVNH